MGGPDRPALEIVEGKATGEGGELRGQGDLLCRDFKQGRESL